MWKNQLIWLLIVLTSCPPSLVWAAASESPSTDAEPLRVAVAPLQDGANDAASVQLAGAMHAALERLGLALVPQRAAQAIVQYQQPAAAQAPVGGSATPTSDVAARVAEAKRAYLNFQNGAAEQALSAVEAQFRADRTLLATQGRLYADALVLRALVAHTAGNAAGMRTALQTLAQVAPLYGIQGSDYPPSFLQAWEQLRNGRASGAVSITSDPSAAEVLVNGISVGQTPLKNFSLPVGRYEVAVVGARYAPSVETIEIAPGREATMRARLQWRESGSSSKSQSPAPSDNDALVQIAAAQRIGQLTHSQRVLVIDVDEAARDSGAVTLRMVDTARGASFAPLVVRYNEDRAALQTQLEKAARKMSRMASADLRKQPGRMVDPGSSGDPAMLAQRDEVRRDRRMRPLLWGLIGLAAVGGIVGGILATGGAGSAATTGALLVHF